MIQKARFVTKSMFLTTNFFNSERIVFKRRCLMQTLSKTRRKHRFRTPETRFSAFHLKMSLFSTQKLCQTVEKRYRKCSFFISDAGRNFGNQWEKVRRKKIPPPFVFFLHLVIIIQIGGCQVFPECEISKRPLFLQLKRCFQCWNQCFHMSFWTPVCVYFQSHTKTGGCPDGQVLQKSHFSARRFRLLFSNIRRIAKKWNFPRLPYKTGGGGQTHTNCIPFSSGWVCVESENGVCARCARSVRGVCRFLFSGPPRKSIFGPRFWCQHSGPLLVWRKTRFFRRFRVSKSCNSGPSEPSFRIGLEVKSWTLKCKCRVRNDITRKKSVLSFFRVCDCDSLVAIASFLVVPWQVSRVKNFCTPRDFTKS